MHPLGVNEVQRCIFLKATAPETAFAPFFLRAYGPTLSKCRQGNTLDRWSRFTYAACVWTVGQTGAPRGNLHQDMENMERPHRKVTWFSRGRNWSIQGENMERSHRKATWLSRDLYQGPFDCEVTMLPTELNCSTLLPNSPFIFQICDNFPKTLCTGVWKNIISHEASNMKVPSPHIKATAYRRPILCKKK